MPTEAPAAGGPSVRRCGDEPMATTVRTIHSECEHCGAGLEQPDDPGRKRRFCSAACKQAAYRARKRREQEARRRAEEEAARRRREEQARRQRERARAHRPPPHAGASRPGPFCGACGGHRGPHTCTTTRPPTTAAAAATTGSMPRPPRPGSPRRPPPAAPRPNSSAPSTACSRLGAWWTAFAAAKEGGHARSRDPLPGRGPVAGAVHGLDVLVPARAAEPPPRTNRHPNQRQQHRCPSHASQPHTTHPVVRWPA
jgi:hypothetical protein